jgi:alkylation response protein AidB-like acyl-CoA dehydrogenase
MKSRDGISFLLVDMKSPGLTVRQIPIMDGRRHVNEVHFDNVSVPTSQRVGEEGQGWAASTVLLGHERLQIAEVPQTRRLLDRAKELARKRLGDDGRPLIEHAHWASHAAVHRRFVSEAEGRAPGAEVSMLKVRGSELRQAVNALTMELLGIDALYLEPSQLSQTGHPQALVQEFLYSRASTIYGGSNEIQRNILARKVLGS